MKTKTVLDERQEKELLEPEHRLCWTAYGGIFVLLLAQALLEVGRVFENIPSFFGGWLLLMVLSICGVVGCLRRGIWSRTFKPSRKTNIIVSVISAAIVGGFMLAVTILREMDIKNTLILCGGTAAVAFLAAYVLLELSAKKFRKIEEKLEGGEE